MKPALSRRDLGPRLSALVSRLPVWYLVLSCASVAGSLRCSVRPGVMATKPRADAGLGCELAAAQRSGWPEDWRDRCLCRNLSARGWLDEKRLGLKGSGVRLTEPAKGVGASSAEDLITVAHGSD